MSKPTKRVLPDHIIDCSEDDFKYITTQDIQVHPKLSIEEKEDLTNIVIYGLNILKYFKRELLHPTPKDLDWYNWELTKPRTFDRNTFREIYLDSEKEAYDYLRLCGKWDRLISWDYFEKHKEELIQKYPIYISRWIIYWYEFWGEVVEGKTPLEWALYFSMEVPPHISIPNIPFHSIIQRTLKEQDIREKIEIGKSQGIPPEEFRLSNKEAKIGKRKVYKLAEKLKKEQGLDSKTAMEMALKSWRSELVASHNQNFQT